ncbi:MAG TPA: DUF115 domain-containing protein [Spirochaetia bacterium]|nr:DUF115 domain-containing protein [Spirochaetia bacterium]
MPEKSLFERNLLALSMYNSGLARELSAEHGTTSGCRVVFQRAKTGSLIPALGEDSSALPLHSTFNPEREGERFKELYTGNGFLLFLGMGAGYHIAPFLAQPEVSSILIIEESLPLFRTILEHIDCHHIFLDPRVKVLVDKSSREIEEYLLATYIPALLGDLKSIPLWPRFNASREYFKGVLKTVEETINQIADDYSVQAAFGKKWFANTLSNLPTAEFTSTTLSPRKKVMVTGAGPSLEDSIKEVKKLRKEYFLIASDTSLPCLMAHDCPPDCVISIDCQQVSYHHFLAGYPRGIPLLLDLASPPVLTRLSDKLLFFSSGHPFSQFVNRNWRRFPFIDTSGGNVSHAAVSLAVNLGAREIALFGVDFSYPEGKTYARGTYLYRHFQSRETRFMPAETRFLNLIFRNKTVLRERDSGFLRYTIKPLLTYKESLETFAGRIEARIVHRRVKGQSLAVPANPGGPAGGINELFAAGPAGTSAREFLFEYREALFTLTRPFNPVVNYLHSLNKDERDLWTTLLPALAALRVEARGETPDGALLLEKTRQYALARLIALVRE